MIDSICFSPSKCGSLDAKSVELKISASMLKTMLLICLRKHRLLNFYTNLENASALFPEIPLDFGIFAKIEQKASYSNFPNEFEQHLICKCLRQYWNKLLYIPSLVSFEAGCHSSTM